MKRRLLSSRTQFQIDSHINRGIKLIRSQTFSRTSLNEIIIRTLGYYLSIKYFHVFADRDSCLSVYRKKYDVISLRNLFRSNCIIFFVAYREIFYNSFA